MDAATIYAHSLVWDDHAGFAMQPDAALDPLLSPWREAGVGYLSINVAYDPDPWPRTFENIAALRRRLPVEAPYCRLVASVAEIDRAYADGLIAATFDIEGMNALNGRLELVELYYALGVRHMLFAYNRNNLAGSGCHDEDTGLSAFGREVIGEMNRVGMVVDCSHCGFNTTMQAMAQSADPVIFSHSNPSALVAHGRNIGDEQIKACAQTGGVIGINGINLFLGETVASAGAVARHAAYVAELVGAEHVGVSLDYAPELGAPHDEQGNTELMALLAQSPEYWPEEAGYGAPINCLDVRRLPDVTQELAAVGFDAGEIRAILGMNFRRVAEQVWK